MPIHSRELLLLDKLIQIPVLLGTTLIMLSSYRNVFTKKHHELEVITNEYHELAYTDTLTGLGNRGYVFEELDKLIAEKRSFITLMIDLDNFKVVNDTYGHLEGDKLLVNVAKQLTKSCPASVSARYGGDEFIIVITKDLGNASSLIFNFWMMCIKIRTLLAMESLLVADIVSIMEKVHWMNT